MTNDNPTDTDSTEERKLTRAQWEALDDKLNEHFDGQEGAAMYAAFNGTVRFEGPDDDPEAILTVTDPDGNTVEL